MDEQIPDNVTPLPQPPITTDTPPAPPRNKGGRPKGSRNKPKTPGRPGRPSVAQTQAKVTKEIEEALSQLLAIPAIPYQLAGEPWMVQHFETAGPRLAHELAVASERNPQMRKILTRAMQGESAMVLIFAVIGYALPPLVHHGIAPSIPALRIVGIQMPPSHQPPTDDVAARMFEEAMERHGAETPVE